MLSQIEYILGLAGIFLLGIDKIALAALPITVCAIMHLKIRKNKRENIIEVSDELYSKNGSATITLGKLSKEFRQIEKEFKRYWLCGINNSSNGTKTGLILANSAISGESASTALRLAKGEERIKEYKGYATAKAKGMYVLTWLGLSFFFPFFSGVGLSIITGSSILANASNSGGIANFFSTAVLAYIFELMLISNAFYNIERSFWYALLDSIFPFSIAFLVLKASSHIFAIL
jgi:hypothetical protein